MRTDFAAGSILEPVRARWEVGEESCISSPFSLVHEKRYEAPALGFVLSGWFDYRSQGGPATGVPGTLIFANAQEYFRCSHRDTLGNKRLVVRFSRDFLEEVAGGCGLPDAVFHRTALAPGKIPMAIFGWMRRLEHARADDDAGYALAALALGAGSVACAAEPVSPRNRQRIFQIVRHIEAFYAQPCALETLAALVDLSRYRFLHLFKAVTGQSPNRYVIDTRLRAAADLLLTTKTPVAQIAFAVGFNDVSHFNASFRTLFDCPPRQWRKGA